MRKTALTAGAEFVAVVSYWQVAFEWVLDSESDADVTKLAGKKQRRYCRQKPLAVPRQYGGRLR